MDNQILTYTLLCYGCFLILCGIVAVSFIGMKAKTALLSGGSSGAVILILSWMNAQHVSVSPFAALLVTLALVVVFSWRSTKTLFTIFEMLKKSEGDLKGKGIAFLIISLMAVVSIIISGIQIVFLFNQKS